MTCIYILNIQPFRVEYRYILYPRQEYFPRPEAEENILYRGYNICRYFTRKGFEYLVYYIGYSLRGTTVSVATYPLTMRSIRGGTLGWNIKIYSTPTNHFDWSVSCAYVINIYIYTDTNPITLPCSLARAGKKHDKTQQNILLKMSPIYPGIHKDPSIGAQT